jgi:hypothetical protein
MSSLEVHYSWFKYKCPPGFEEEILGLRILSLSYLLASSFIFVEGLYR